jgi:diguanylate cyclase (GGDEF)-like protein
MQSRRLLEQAALHDPLTGLLNRKGFERATAGVIESLQKGVPAAIVMIDLDRFKPINDGAGHAAGDAMLAAIAQAIKSHVRSTDAVARLGGDEFVLFLPNCDQNRATAVADKVRHAISDVALIWEGKTLRVGASLGVAELLPGFQSVAQWLDAADVACYEAKRAGRGTVRVASSSTQLRLVNTQQA